MYIFTAISLPEAEPFAVVGLLSFDERTSLWFGNPYATQAIKGALRCQPKISQLLQQSDNGYQSRRNDLLRISCWQIVEPLRFNCSHKSFENFIIGNRMKTAGDKFLNMR